MLWRGNRFNCLFDDFVHNRFNWSRFEHVIHCFLNERLFVGLCTKQIIQTVAFGSGSLFRRRGCGRFCGGRRITKQVVQTGITSRSWSGRLFGRSLFYGTAKDVRCSVRSGHTLVSASWSFGGGRCGSGFTSTE